VEIGSTQSAAVTIVSFQIFSPNLVPEDVAINLGQPDHIHHAGDYPRNDPKYSAYKDAMWSIDSKISNSQPLEVHLDKLLLSLEPKQAYIRSLSQTTTVNFYCDLFGQIGFQLSAQILQRISNL